MWVLKDNFLKIRLILPNFLKILSKIYLTILNLANFKIKLFHNLKRVHKIVSKTCLIFMEFFKRQSRDRLNTRRPKRSSARSSRTRRPGRQARTIWPASTTTSAFVATCRWTSGRQWPPMIARCAPTPIWPRPTTTAPPSSTGWAVLRRPRPVFCAP
jgi:hypothetical protein